MEPPTPFIPPQGTIPPVYNDKPTYDLDNELWFDVLRIAKLQYQTGRIKLLTFQNIDNAIHFITGGKSGLGGAPIDRDGEIDWLLAYDGAMQNAVIAPAVRAAARPYPSPPLWTVWKYIGPTFDWFFFDGDTGQLTSIQFRPSITRVLKENQFAATPPNGNNQFITPANFVIEIVPAGSPNVLRYYQLP